MVVLLTLTTYHNDLKRLSSYCIGRILILLP